MIDVIFQMLGGLGLFLIAMGMLTDGLKGFAGDQLGQALARFTGTPAKAFMSGALITLLVQSSTATTVTLIGFVSAGLITFTQAVGVVMGASLGTTGTGWLVSVLGLKISLGFYAMPLVGIGAFLQLAGRHRWRPLGTSIAGFGLLFVAIEILQTGMAGVATRIDLAEFTSDTLAQRALIVGLGLIMTVLLQSSAAAVATTLTALHTGAVNFEQAALVVIGAAIGTTVTGVVAAMGGTIMAKRTAMSHVVFNLLAGLIALLLLPMYLALIEQLQTHLGLTAGPTSLAAFHSLFLALGVALVLPFATQYAQFIQRLVPDRGTDLARHLDHSVLALPPLALQATEQTLSEIAKTMHGHLQALLEGRSGTLTDTQRLRLNQALGQTQDFFARIPTNANGASFLTPRLAQMHAIDHLARLQSRLHASPELTAVLRTPRFTDALAQGQEAMRLAAAGLAHAPLTTWEPRLRQCAANLADMRRTLRADMLHETASGDQPTRSALLATDAMRWLERSVHHLYRITAYLHPDTHPDDAPPDQDPEHEA